MSDETWRVRALDQRNRRLAAEARASELEEALRFYADPDTYEEWMRPGDTLGGMVPIRTDRGAIARALLAPTQSGSTQPQKETR